MVPIMYIMVWLTVWTGLDGTYPVHHCMAYNVDWVFPILHTKICLEGGLYWFLTLLHSALYGADLSSYLTPVSIGFLKAVLEYEWKGREQV